MREVWLFCCLNDNQQLLTKTNIFLHPTLRECHLFEQLLTPLLKLSPTEQNAT